MVVRRNARGGRSAAEHLIAALRCLYRHAVADGLIAEADNPAPKVAKPRRLPRTRRAVPDTRLAEINQVAATTGNDPELDTLLLRLHTETACRRGGALALRPTDLDPEQCLILLREKGETVRWQPVSPTLMAPPAARTPSERARTRRRAAAALPQRRPDHLPPLRPPVAPHRPSTCPGWPPKQISTHWLRHTTLTWVERNFGYAVARAYAGHTDSGGDDRRHRHLRPRQPARGRRRTGRPHRRTTPFGRTAMTARPSRHPDVRTTTSSYPAPQCPDPSGARSYRTPRSRGRALPVADWLTATSDHDADTHPKRYQ